jgi:hypothetical protein
MSVSEIEKDIDDLLEVIAEDIFSRKMSIGELKQNIKENIIAQQWINLGKLHEQLENILV